jgi:hypothetical protein
MRSFIPAFLILLLAGCSNDSDDPVAPPTTDARGVKIGADHTFAANSSLAWSDMTAEVIGPASATPAAGNGLLAMSTTSGATRLLDGHEPVSVTVSNDGHRAFYIVDLPPAEGDSVTLRTAVIHGSGSPTRIAACPEGSVMSYAVSADQNWVAWAAGPGDPGTADTLRLTYIPTGAITVVGVGSPVVVSPGGDYLLYRPNPGSQAMHLWVRANGNDAEYTQVVVPIGAGPAAWRWDSNTPGGLKVAYIVSPTDLFVARDIPGLPVMVYRASDELDVIAPAWSPDGQRLAVWGWRLAANGNYTNHILFVADITSNTGVQVAYGSQVPGGVALSGGGLKAAALFGEQLFVSDVHGLSLAASQRSSAGRVAPR